MVLGVALVIDSVALGVEVVSSLAKQNDTYMYAGGTPEETVLGRNARRNARGRKKPSSAANRPRQKVPLASSVYTCGDKCEHARDSLAGLLRFLSATELILQPEAGSPPRGSGGS